MTSGEREVAQARRLSGLLIRSAERSKARFSAAVEPFGLPVPLARALLVLSVPTPMGELAEQLAFDPSYITGLADQLEHRGLIVRVPGIDRRVKNLELTEEGRVLRERVFTAVNENLTMVERLSESERETLGTLLERLLEPDQD